MDNKKKVVILGAGVAGLSMGHFLATKKKYDVTIVEKNLVIGGLCGSFKHNDFTLDYGAHKLYSVIPGVLDDIKGLMGSRLIEVPKKNRIFLQGKLLDYPMRLGNLMKVMGFGLFLKLGFGYAFGMIGSLFNKKELKNYEDYMIKAFGKPAYQLIFEPLADKVWGKPVDLHCEMARTRVPASGGFEIILKLLGLKKETAQTNAEYFYYPRVGFGDFPQVLKESIDQNGGQILLGAEVLSFKKENNHVVSISYQIDGIAKELDCDMLISTIPLSSLSRYVFPQNGKSVEHKVDALKSRHLILVYLFIDKDKVLEDQWIFFPERKFIFSRIFEQKQMNRELGPKDKTVICCDFTCEDDSESWKANDQYLADQCIDGLVEAGFIKKEEVTSFLIRKQKNFYPRYDLNFMEKMTEGNNQLKQVNNLLLTGRLGMYNYNNSDHCFDMARVIVNELEKGKNTKDVWSSLEEHIKDYQIVD